MTELIRELKRKHQAKPGQVGKTKVNTPAYRAAMQSNIGKARAALEASKLKQIEVTMICLECGEYVTDDDTIVKVRDGVLHHHCAYADYDAELEVRVSA
jgi:hypothetical protein